MMYGGKDRDPGLSELQKESTRQHSLKTGFRIFAEGTIEKDNTEDAAEAGDAGIRTAARRSRE